jgi:aspartate racemase
MCNDHLYFGAYIKNDKFLYGLSYSNSCFDGFISGVKMNEMKLLGLIGGLSFASSLDYYRLINEQIGQRLGRLHSSRLILYSLDLESYSKFAYQSDLTGLFSFVADAAEVLYRAGAEILVICSNTAHMAFPTIQKRIPDLPILHIAEK